MSSTGFVRFGLICCHEGFTVSTKMDGSDYVNVRPT